MEWSDSYSIFGDRDHLKAKKWLIDWDLEQLNPVLSTFHFAKELTDQK
jgi:hypothetical protein